MKRFCFVQVLFVALAIKTANPQTPSQQPQITQGTFVLKSNGKTELIPVPEAIQLVNQLFAAINPNDQANSYMTPFMKEKLSLFNTGFSTRQIVFEPVATFYKNPDGTDNLSVLMTSSYTDSGHLPLVVLYIPRLLTMVRLQ